MKIFVEISVSKLHLNRNVLLKERLIFSLVSSLRNSVFNFFRLSLQ